MSDITEEEISTQSESELEGLEVVDDTSTVPADTDFVIGKKNGGVPKFFKLANLWSWISGKVNSALTNLSETKIETKVTYAECMPTTANKTTVYSIDYNKDGDNRPANGYNFIVTSSRIGTSQGVQTAQGTTTGENYPSVMFIRYMNNNRFTSWRKLTTETDLNSALTAHTDFEATLPIEGTSFNYKRMFIKNDMAFVGVNIKFGSSVETGVNTTVLNLPNNAKSGVVIQAEGTIQSSTTFTPVKITINPAGYIMMTYAGGTIPVNSSLSFAIYYPLF